MQKHPHNKGFKQNCKLFLLSSVSPVSGHDIWHVGGLVFIPQQKHPFGHVGIAKKLAPYRVVVISQSDKQLAAFAFCIEWNQ